MRVGFHGSSYAVWWWMSECVVMRKNHRAHRLHEAKDEVVAQNHTITLRSIIQYCRSTRGQGVRYTSITESVCVRYVVLLSVCVCVLFFFGTIASCTEPVTRSPAVGCYVISPLFL